MMRHVLVLVALACFAALADDDLAGIRNLATSLQKSRNAGGDSAYCELASIIKMEGCFGKDSSVQRIRIGRKGMIETWVHRSLRESGEPIGYTRGRIRDSQWRELLRAIMAMREEPLPRGMPMPLPPEPYIPFPKLILSDGKTKVEYSHHGPSMGSIGDAFAKVDILAGNTSDTVWQLSLINPKAEIRKDSVHVTAEWKWRGPAGSRLQFSEAAGGELCGTARFKWYRDTSEYSVDWHVGTLTAGKGRAMGWDLPGAKANTLSLAFPYDGPKGKIKRVGLIDGIGIRLIPGGTKDTVSATVFTDRFDF